LGGDDDPVEGLIAARNWAGGVVHLSQSPIAAAPNRKLDAAVLPVFFLK
jgi:hypothetical protein